MFASSEVKSQVKMLLSQGMKAKKILAQVGGELVARDVYTLASEMRASGELKKAAVSASSSTPKKNAKKKIKKSVDEFAIALEREIKNVEIGIQRMKNLAQLYDKTNSEFAAFLEAKIEREQKKLDALHDFQFTNN